MERIRDAGVEDGVFPIHADARSLPFAAGFFDAIVSIDSFFYYGTDDLYLNYLARFVKPGGPIGIAGAGLMQEIDGAVPDHLRDWWTPGLSGASIRRPGGAGIGNARASWTSNWPTPCPTAGNSGWTGTEPSLPTTQQKSRRSRPIADATSATFASSAAADGDAQLGEHIVSVPTEYARKPLLRGEGLTDDD